jgi:serine protease Do
MIKVEAENMSILPTEDSDNILVEESVIAIGNPFGLSHTVTFGIVIAKGRTRMEITEYEDFIKVDAAINPEDSKGPFIDLEGKIVGANTAVFRHSGGYRGIDFAVPIDIAHRVMNELIETGQFYHGWLGVRIQDMTPGVG